MDSLLISFVAMGILSLLLSAVYRPHTGKEKGDAGTPPDGRLPRGEIQVIPHDQRACTYRVSGGIEARSLVARGVDQQFTLDWQIERNEWELAQVDTSSKK